MMATSHTFPTEESLPHPPPNFQTQQMNTKQAVIYNKSGTKCMNIVKDPSGIPLSPTSPSTRDQTDISPSHNLQNNNGTAKKKKKKKGKRKSPVDHLEESDIQVNVSYNNHIKTHQVNCNSDEEDLEEEGDEFFSDDEGYDPEDPEIPFPRKNSIANQDVDNHHAPTTPSKKKKKKKKNKNGLSMNQISDIHHNHSHHNHNHKSRKDGIWNTNNNEERQRIREFWLQLGEEERRSLVKVEKEAVLKKMKEQQKHSCSCSVCGKKRTAIEAELETLYDAYYEELESYANHQQQFGSSNIDYRNDPDFDDEEDDDDYEDDDDDDEDYDGSEHDGDTRKEFFNNFGNSLTVKGGILTVADDLLKNDGKKFLEMMERLAERRMQREEEEAAMDRGEYYDEDEDDDEEDYEEDGEEDNQTEEQRMEEGRRMFQIFAARMFEQRVLNAYREKVAQERQQKLLEELEEENRLKEERELKKLKEKERKKAKNRALKQQKEEERARKEAEKLAEEKAQQAEREKKLEEERKRREEERLKKEAERRQREEERQRKEEEKRRKAKEEKEREERRKREQEAKERKEREKEEKERKEREEKARKEKEERRQREERERKQRELKEKERKEREEQERKKKEREAKERERKEKEELERKDREEKERKEKEEKQKAINVPPIKQQQQQHHERKRTITPIGQPSAQPPPPPTPPPTTPTISTPIQNKPVSSIANGMNWINYSSHDQHQPLPQHSISPQHIINSHLPPPPNHPSHPPPHPLFNPGGPQPQFGGQPVGMMNGPAGMTNEVVNEVFTNTKKVINPPPQGTNTLQGINPTTSLFASGLGPIGMGVHPHHGGPPVPMHAHQVMRQQMPPPRGFNPIAPTPHLPGPSGVPPSVASTNLSLLNEATVMNGTGVTGNPQTGAFGGLPMCGGQGPLGPQTFNLGSQVVNQPASSHMGPNVVPNTPLAPIGHRRMSQHPEDSHIKTVQRPQPIQRPRRNSSTGQSIETSTRSPPPGFGNMVGSGALLDDKTHPMANRRQSLASGESSYFSNSLFSTAMTGESNPPQPSQNQQQQQHGTNRLSHRPVMGDNEWPPIRGRQSVDNTLGEPVSNNNGSNNIGTTDIWGSNYVGGQSLWYSEGNNPTNRRVMGSRDLGIP